MLALHTQRYIEVGFVLAAVALTTWKLNQGPVASPIAPAASAPIQAKNQSRCSPTSLCVRCDKLYSTGVDNNGQRLTEGTVDPHWTLVKYQRSSLSTDALRQTYPSGAPVYAVQGFFGNEAVSPEAHGRDMSGDGYYVYQTIFTNHGNTKISGRIFIDDGVTDVFLNGQRVPLAFDGRGTERSPDGHERKMFYEHGHFAVLSEFKNLNTLSIVGINAGGWHSIEADLTTTSP